MTKKKTYELDQLLEVWPLGPGAELTIHFGMGNDAYSAPLKMAACHLTSGLQSLHGTAAAKQALAALWAGAAAAIPIDEAQARKDARAVFDQILKPDWPDDEIAARVAGLLDGPSDFTDIDEGSFAIAYLIRVVNGRDQTRRTGASKVTA